MKEGGGNAGCWEGMNEWIGSAGCGVKERGGNTGWGGGDGGGGNTGCGEGVKERGGNAGRGGEGGAVNDKCVGGWACFVCVEGEDLCVRVERRV